MLVLFIIIIIIFYLFLSFCLSIAIYWLQVATFLRLA
jgi:hypothetical protein